MSLMYSCLSNYNFNAYHNFARSLRFMSQCTHGIKEYVWVNRKSHICLYFYIIWHLDDRTYRKIQVWYACTHCVTPNVLHGSWWYSMEAFRLEAFKCNSYGNATNTILYSGLTIRTFSVQNSTQCWDIWQRNHRCSRNTWIIHLCTCMYCGLLHHSPLNVTCQFMSIPSV